MASQPYIGEICIGSFNFAPKGCALCNGQTLPINQNQALFSLLGTTYGGNGVTTFALPDLRSRTPIHMGTANGQTYTQGQTGGTEQHTLTTTEMPMHNHLLNASSDLGDAASPSGAFPANTDTLDNEYKTSQTTPVTMASTVMGSTGGNVPFSILQPYLAVNFYIALLGVFPSRN